MTAANETATEVATEVIQKAAAPVAFIAIVVAGALAVAALVRRFGSSLPPPAYASDAPSYVVDEDQDDEDQEQDEEHDEPEERGW